MGIGTANHAPRRTIASWSSGIAAACVTAVLALLASQPPAQSQSGQTDWKGQLRAAVDGKQRTEPNKVRDRFRKPYEVIEFLEIKPDSNVIEISPGAVGYWTEVLAPYLRDRGVYIAANPAPTSPAAKANVDQFNKQYAAKLAADPANYGKVKVVDFAPERKDFATPGSADFVLTFRNLHNWMDRGVVEQALASFHSALKKGGILGIKDHRGDPTKPQDPVAQSGYVREDFAIRLVESAGFKLLAKSEVVANPKDTKNYPVGVWALPPTFRMKDQERARLAAIGESDRFLLKFVKQ